MTTDHCGPGRWPDVGNAEVPCCYGSAHGGPGCCTCWRPVFDLVQQEPRTDMVRTNRPAMCRDCAYRPGSPERSADPDAAADREQLRAIAETGRPFWCHQGMRRPVFWRHPSGAITPGSSLNYQPPIVNGVPYKSDGTPGDVCAGWTALRIQAMQREGVARGVRPD